MINPEQLKALPPRSLIWVRMAQPIDEEQRCQISAMLEEVAPECRFIVTPPGMELAPLQSDRAYGVWLKPGQREHWPEGCWLKDANGAVFANASRAVATAMRMSTGYPADWAVREFGPDGLPLPEVAEQKAE